MADKTLLIGVFLLNAAATLLSLLPARLHGHRLGAGRLLFGFLLPVAGAIVCWLFACCPAPSDDVLAEFKRNTEAHREIISSARGTAHRAFGRSLFDQHAPKTARAHDEPAPLGSPKILGSAAAGAL